ncbi:MAG: AraC family transcriptional regulator [Akkermansiaceae bacterium]|nr:AraC family transcriptional regulator [Akkermansiaceae bacterium]
MDRRAIPSIGMTHYGEDWLRTSGILSMHLPGSVEKDPVRLSPHYHDFFQISFIQSECHLMHDFREKTLHRTCLFFVGPGHVHTIRPNLEMEGTVVSFTRDFFDARQDGVRGLLSEFPFFHAADAEPWLEIPAALEDEFRKHFAEIQQEFDLARPGAGEILRCLLRMLFVKATRLHTDRDDGPPTTRSAALVRSFLKHVEEHFLTWKTLAPYARELGISANHLNDVVSAETGHPAGEHIRLRTMLDAKRLLLYSELSVAEIGYGLGFKDPSYFGRFFRRYGRCTPADFRSQIREKYHQDP